MVLRVSALLTALCPHLPQEYVKHSKHPFLPITRVAQGQHNTQFEGAFDDTVPVSGG